MLSDLFYTYQATMLTSLDTVRMILNVLEEVTICISAIDEK